MSVAFHLSLMSFVFTDVWLAVGVWLSDEGIYICQAKNQFGIAKAEARVSVTGLGKLSSKPHCGLIKCSYFCLVVSVCLNISPAEPPLLAQAAPIMTTVTGQSLSIPCMLLDGIPLPERHWTKNGKLVSLTCFKYTNPINHTGVLFSLYICFLWQVTLNGRMFSRSDGSLYIERTVAEDTGIYVCTAVNVAGSTHITVNVEVHGRRLTIMNS